MEEIKKIVVNGLEGHREYGIEDSEARENVQEIMEGAPEELNSFKEAFEAFKKGGEALAGVKVAIEDEAKRAQEAEKANADAITVEKERAEKHLADEVEKLKAGDTIVAQTREIYSRNGKTVTDSFLVRTTAGSGTIGDGVATLKSVGGNIVKNLVDGNWSTFGANGNPQISFDKGIAKAVINGRYQGLRCPNIKFIAGHKYYISCIINNKTNGNCFIQVQGVGGYSKVAADMFLQSSQVITATGDENTLIVITDGTSGEFYAAKPLLIDLTEMFDDGNEPSIKECDRLFGTMDALPQGLAIANPTIFKSTGYNQADPDKVLVGKGIDNGAIVDKIGSLAVVPCLPCKIGVGENNGYCIHGAFDEGTENVYLTPFNPLEVEGELYLRKLTKDADKGTYVPQIKGYMLVEVPNATDLCVHFLWSEDRGRHDFEPYYESVVELPTIPEMPEYGLAGIYVNRELIADTIDLEKCIYTKRLYKDADGNFQPLAEPIEYPLLKINNNYTSSDYGVEQFDGVVPCNANNLYYMRSLVGETRNFLDRLYDNTTKTDAKEVADYITSGIEDNKQLATNAPNLALRALYVAAGAVYNTNTGFYELNGVKDLNENDIAKIYNYKEVVYNLQSCRILQDVNIRALYPRPGYILGAIYNGAAAINGFYSFASTNLEVFNLGSTAKLDTTKADEIPQCSTFGGMFYKCRNLHTIYPLNLANVQTIGVVVFKDCVSLKVVRLYRLSQNISLSDSPLIDKESVLYMIKNAIPTSAITITLHADAYARLADDTEIVAALAAQPLITLVSA